MANWSDLKAAISQVIKTNGTQAITGQILQDSLNNIVSNIGKDCTFAGIATTKTNPGVPDGNVFYLATEAGTYYNFNGISIAYGEAVILEWRGSWVKKTSGLSTVAKLTDIENKKQDKLTFDKTPTLKSNNPVTSDGIRTALDLQKSEVDAAKEEAIKAINDNEQSAIVNFNAQKVTPEMLSESTKQFIESSGGGNITNLADDEDIVSKENDLGIKVLKFSDRRYDSHNFTGKGYKILRKNIVDGNNVLSQDMIEEANTVYDIRYDFDLGGQTITIAEGCILKFNGGSLRNGTISFNKTAIVSDKYKIFTNIILSGTLNTDLYFDYFGVISNDENSAESNTTCINIAINSIKTLLNNTIKFSENSYIYISGEISINLDRNTEKIFLNGNNSTIECINGNYSNNYAIYVYQEQFSTTVNVKINNLTIKLQENAGGILCGQTYCNKIDNVYIISPKESLSCIKISKGNELVVSHCKFIGNSKKESYGVTLLTSDCLVTEVIMVNCKKAIYQSGASNRFSNIHAWISDPSIFKGSSMFIFGSGQVFIENCVSDTYHYTFYSINAPYIFSTNTKIIQNTDVTNQTDVLTYYAIMVEGNTGYYSLLGAYIEANSKQRLSNVSLDKCLNMNGTYNGPSNEFIKSYGYAGYNDTIPNGNTDGIITSAQFRLLPAFIWLNEGKLYRILFDINQYKYNTFSIHGESGGSPFYIIVTAYAGQVKIHNITNNNPPFNIYTKNNYVFIKCGSTPNTPYNCGILICKDGYTEITNNTIDDSYVLVPMTKYNASPSGIFNNKPTESDGIKSGFAYFCTDKQTVEGSTNGIMIYYKGNNVWVDALGRVVN